MTPRRIVAVDYGRKRVGLAMTDPLRMFARPIGTFDPRRAIEELHRLDRDEGIETIVLGWPLLPDGSEGDALKRVGEYFNRLSNAFPNADVLRWDERYTSEMARTLLSEQGARRGKSAHGIDTIAACIILQDYLER